MAVEQFKICPRCNEKVDESKNVCTHCGALLKDAPPLARSEQSDQNRMLGGTAAKKKVRCVVCAKPPESPVTCPNCGTTNICSWHVYKFFSDNEESPEGCPRCGPRCAVCGAQTTLSHHKERAVCNSCLSVLTSSTAGKQQVSQKTIDFIHKCIVTIFVIVGVLAGVFHVTGPQAVNYFNSLIKVVKLNQLAVQVIGGVVGLVAGSLAASIINSFIKKR